MYKNQSGFTPIQIILSILVGVVVLGGIVGGVLYYSKQSNQQVQQGSCGDGVCGPAEKADLNLCPQDCEGQTVAPSAQAPSPTGQQPTNTEQINWDSPFGIFGPYETLSAQNPLKSVSKTDINSILKDIGVWVEEMPRGDNINEISKSGANIYSRIMCTGKTPPYTSDQKCKDSIRSTINQYKDTIKYWEFGTEPNGLTPPTGWKGYAKEYATDLKEAYTIVKEECPDCYVVFGGLGGVGVGATEMPGGAADFLKDALSAGAGSYFDVFEFKQHSANASDYKEIVTKLNIYSKIFSDNGVNINNKLIFIETATHDGSPNPKYNYSPGLKSQTQAQQATGLLKYYIYSISQGIDKIFWNLVYERHNFGSTGATRPDAPSIPEGSSVFDYYGLINNPDNDGDSSKKLAYYTYKKMVEVLDGSDWNNIQTIQEKDGIYIYKFTKNNKVTDYSTAFNTETKTVSGGKVTITLKDIPVFVEGN
ncbi:MAG: hypothetical protein UT83_C0010G0020 [Parcubacteria group bacterium GW2011_GWA2_40_143]|nr:MAG: hypothetical protein UT83_C0010G0020 [Parcubacteria group bacterium GW2011_GWA2_40_143]